MSVIPIQTNSFKVADFNNVSSGVDASLQEINFFNTVTISSGNDVNGTYLTINGGYAERMVGGSGANSVTVTCKEITPNCISVIEIRNATNTQTLAKRKIGHTTVAQKVVIKVPDGIYGKYVKMYSESGTFALYSIHGIEAKEAAYEATPSLSDMPLTDIHQGSENSIRFSYNGKYSILGNDYYPVLQNDGTWKVSSTAKSIDIFGTSDGWDHISDIGWRIDWYTANTSRCAYITDEGVAIDWNWGTLTHFVTSTKFAWLTDDIFITWPFNQTNPTLKIYRFIAPADPSAGGTFTDANFVKLSEYQITTPSPSPYSAYLGRMVSPNKKYFCLCWGNNNIIIKFTDDFTSVVHASSPINQGTYPLNIPGSYTISNDGLQLLLPDTSNINVGWCMAYYTRPDDTSDFTLVETTKNGVSKLFPGHTQKGGIVRFTADNKLLFLGWNANKVSKYNNVYTDGNGFEVIETITLGHNHANVSYTFHDINLAGTLIGVGPTTTSVKIYGNTIGNFNKLPAIDGSVGIQSKLAWAMSATPTSLPKQTYGIIPYNGYSTSCVLSPTGKYLKTGMASTSIQYHVLQSNGTWTSSSANSYGATSAANYNLGDNGWDMYRVETSKSAYYIKDDASVITWTIDSGLKTHMGITTNTYAMQWLPDNKVIIVQLWSGSTANFPIFQFIPPSDPTTAGTLNASNFVKITDTSVNTGNIYYNPSHVKFRTLSANSKYMLFMNGYGAYNGSIPRLVVMKFNDDYTDIVHSTNIYYTTSPPGVVTNGNVGAHSISNDGLRLILNHSTNVMYYYERENDESDFTQVSNTTAGIFSDRTGTNVVKFLVNDTIMVIPHGNSNSTTIHYYDGTTYNNGFTKLGTMNVDGNVKSSEGGYFYDTNVTGSIIGIGSYTGVTTNREVALYGNTLAYMLRTTSVTTNANKFVDLTSTDETVISSGYDLSLQEITYNITGSISGIDTNYTVTVQNVSGQNVFFLNGVQQKTLTLLKGETYTFTQTDSSNTTHGIKIVDALNGSTDATAYSYTGTAGTDGSGSFTVPSNAPDTLYYRCVNHHNMGGTIKVIENYNLGRPLIVEGTGYLEKTLLSSDTTVSIRYRKASTGTETTFQVLNADQTDLLAEAKITQTAWPQKVVLGFSSGVGNVLRVNENGTGEFYEMLGNTATEFLTEDISSSTSSVVTVDPMTQDIPGPKPYYYDSAKRTILHGNIGQGNYYMSRYAGQSQNGVLTTDTINGQTVDVYEQNAPHYQYFDAEHVMYALSATFKSTKPISGYNDRPHYICSFITDGGGYYTSVQFDNGYLSLRGGTGSSTQYEFAKGRIAVKSEDWNTVIMVKDYSQLRIKVYLNGYLDIDFTYSENSVYNDKSLSAVSPIVYSDGMMQGGWWMQNSGNTSSTNFFKMYEIRAWDRPLTDAEAFEASIIQDTPYYMYQDFSTVSSSLALHTDGWNSKFIDGGNADSSLLIESATDGMKFSGSGTNGYEISKTIPDDTTHVRVIGHAVGSGVVQVKNGSGTVVAETLFQPVYSTPPSSDYNLLLHLSGSSSDIIPSGISFSYETTNSTYITGNSSINISESPTSATHFLVPEFNNFGTNTTFTFSLWFYKTGSVPGTNYAGLITHEQHKVTNIPTTGAWGHAWSFSYSDTNLYFWRSNTWWSTSVSFAIPNNKWTFLSFSMNGFDITIYYVDETGTMNTHTATMTSTYNGPVGEFDNGGFWVGKFGHGGSWVDEADSYMDSIRYYDKVLTQAEVQAIYDEETHVADLTFSSGTGNTLHVVKSSGSPGTVELSKVLLNSRETDDRVKYCLNIDQNTGDYVNNVTWGDKLAVSSITASSILNNGGNPDINILVDGVIESYYSTSVAGDTSYHTYHGANPEYLEFTLDATSIVTSVVMYRSQLNYLTRNNNYTIKLLDSNGALLEEKTNLSYTSDDIPNFNVSKHPSFFTEGIGKLTTTFTNGVSASKVRIENYSSSNYIVLSEVQIYGSTPFIQPSSLSILGDNYYSITKASGDSLHASVTYKDYHMFMALTASGPSTLLSYNDSSNTNKTMTFSSFSSPWERANAKATLTNGDIVYGQANDNNASSSPSNAFNATNDGLNFWQSTGGGGAQEIGYEFQSGPKTITSMKFTQNNYQTSNLLASTLSIKYWNGSAWTVVSNASATGFPVDQRTQLGQVTITFDAAESQYWVVDVGKLNAYSSIGEWELHGPPQKILDFGTTKWTISSGTLNAYDNSGTQQLARSFSVGSGFFVLELGSGFAKVHASGEVQFSTVSSSSINSLTFSSDTEVNIGDLYIYESISDSDRTALLNTLYTKWNTSTTVPASKVPVISIDGDNNDSLQSSYTVSYSPDRATLLSPNGYRGSGINLTTATNYLQTNVTLKNTSVSFWFKLAGSAPSNNYHHSLIHFRDSSGTEKAHFYTGNNTQAYQRDGIRFYSNDLSVMIEPLTKAQRPRDASTWYHMCLTCDEYGVVKLYENGYMYADDVFTDTVKNGSIYDYHLCLGKYSSVPGALYDEIKVYKGVLTQAEVTALASVSKPPTTLLGNSTDYINNGAGNEKLSPYSVNDYTPVSGATGALAGMTLYIEPPRAIHSGTKIYADIPTSTFVSGGYRNIWSLIDASTNAEMSAVFSNGDILDLEIVIEFPYAIDVSSVTHTNRAHASHPNQDKDIDKIEYWDGSAYQTITTTPTTPWTNPDGAQGTKYDFVFSSIIKAEYFKISYSGGRVIGELELHSSYKYLGFYTTSVNAGKNPQILEMIMNYTGGTIGYNSTEEIGATTSDLNLELVLLI